MGCCKQVHNWSLQGRLRPNREKLFARRWAGLCHKSTITQSAQLNSINGMPAKILGEETVMVCYDDLFAFPLLFFVFNMATQGTPWIWFNPVYIDLE